MIATLDGVYAGLQPRRAFNKVSTAVVIGIPHSFWYEGGNPPAGAAPVTNQYLGTPLSSSSGLITGQIPHYDPLSGDSSYLARFQAAASQPGTLMLCDRLLQSDSISNTGAAIDVTSTSEQFFNTAPMSRPLPGSSGVDVLCGFEVVSTTGAGTPTIALKYTNSDSVALRSAALIDPIVGSKPPGTFFRFGLQSGDVGIKSVNSITLSATMTSGSVAIVLYRVLASLELVAGGITNALDALTSGFPQILNGAVPFLIFIPSATSNVFINGEYVETQG